MSNVNETHEKRGWWAVLKRPSARYSLGGLLGVGFILGILFWGGFNTAMEQTNQLSFCISCHEMKDNVYQEYRNTIHYANRTGVRATCPDCHVPKDWMHKVVRKIKASNEVFHWLLGTIDSREKFQAHRLELAKHVWASMKATDSRECRNCHNYEAMDYEVQSRRAVPQHMKGFEEGKTCIDCHKGIAHQLPDMSGVDPTATMKP